MKLYVARDSDGTVCLYTNKPVLKQYETGHYAYDSDGGQYAEIPELYYGEVREINFV